MSEINISLVSVKEFLSACHDGDLDIVKKYIEQGGDIHVKTSNGNDGFSRAIYRGNLEVADYLLEQGADINSQSLKGKTPLHRAIQRGKLDSIKFLVRKGANLDVQDKKGNTPLHNAAKFNYNKVAKLLIDNGANVKIFNLNQQTALDVAKSKDQSGKKLLASIRNIIENNHLISDKLGSVQEIIEEKLLADSNTQSLDDNIDRAEEMSEDVEQSKHSPEKLLDNSQDDLPTKIEGLQTETSEMQQDENNALGQEAQTATPSSDVTH